jgi:1-acyl-sn-glycerol-3-phosphate acyltransferase
VFIAMDMAMNGRGGPSPEWPGSNRNPRKKMTVYDTVIAQTLMRWTALMVFKCAGWKVEGEKPEAAKYVAIAAPHTSNWDFLYTLCLAFIYRINPRIMMKDAWFFWPLGPVLRWLGAMPVDRSKSKNVVGQSIDAFNRSDRMVLVVPPSGTRRKVTHWKSGFYHIANGAQVPIALGFLDYRRKRGGFGPTLVPTGDIHGDMGIIQRFYEPVTGKYPLQESRNTIAPVPRPPC